MFAIKDRKKSGTEIKYIHMEILPLDVCTMNHPSFSNENQTKEPISLHMYLYLQQ